MYPDGDRLLISTGDTPANPPPSLVHKKLETFHKKSTRDRINALDVMSCMTSAKIDSLKGTTEYFFLNW